MRFLLRGGSMRLMLAAAVVCSFALPSTAYAFCRTTTEPLPQSYSPTRGCFTDGLYLYWQNACVGYSLNQAASRTISYDDAKRIIDTAFGTWMKATCDNTGSAPGIVASNLGASDCDEIRYNADSANQNLIVFRDDEWPYNDAYNTLGLTTVTFNARTGEIYDADMEINSSAHNLSISDQVPTNGFDLLSVVTHEAGHFYGLAHAPSATSTMYASYKPGTTALRTLAADDIAGICSIYPDSATRTVSAETSSTGAIEADSCDPTPRHGFTTECVVPKSTSKCEATSQPISSSWSAFALVGIVGACARRRVRASS
jgi:hypothetical protein